MKRSIKLAALFILISSCLFAAAPAPSVNFGPTSNSTIKFSPLPSNAGLNVQVDNKKPGKVIVIIFDEYANVYLKEIIPVDTYLTRDYILTRLENGNYTLEVTSNKKVMKKYFRVYDGQCYVL